MTQIIIAIALWCGGGAKTIQPKEEPAGTWNINRQYVCSQDTCRQLAMECMTAKKWDEKALVGCLGANK